MIDIINAQGLARHAKFTLTKGGLVLPGALMISGYPPYAPDDIIMQTDDKAVEARTVLWGGNPLVDDERTSDEALFTIPAHIPYPSSLNKESGRYFLETEISKGHRLFTILNGPHLVKDPRTFAEVLSGLLDNAGPQDIIYAPGVGEPAHVAVLCYLGIDLFDSQPAVKAALRGSRLVLGTPGEISTEAPLEEVLNANYTLLRNELGLVREAIRTGEIRNLAEERANSDINMMALLRTFDEKYYSTLERDLGLGGKGTYKCISRESLNRPAVLRWRQRLEDRYTMPPSAKILLLLPCSAKKPYSFSKSHNIFRSHWEHLEGMAAVHEVIITSPLGVVPRELELYHPANSYDIPVIGLWDSNERDMIRGTLQSFLTNNQYEKCIVHFADREIVEPVLDEFFNDVFYTTEDGRPTSDVSLFNLKKALENVLEEMDFVSKVQRKKEDMLNRFSFQFDRGFIEELPEFRVLGRYPFLKAMSDKAQLGMIVEARGGISLTIQGAELLAKTGNYVVEIEDFVPKGTVFAVGITDATDDIRPGDEVVLVHDGAVKGSGTALMSGRQMRLSDRGGAVVVRHYKKDIS